MARLIKIKLIEKLLRIGGRMKKAQDLVRQAEIEQQFRMMQMPVECRMENCHCRGRQR